MTDEPEEESEYVMVDASGNLVTEVHGENAESDKDISDSDDEEEEEEEEESEEDSDELSEDEDSDEVNIEPTVEELAGE